ncbi:MAG: MFS transporter [Burkholderiaceae bacterium]|nr:MFS transporter [Burkholderiaceae bacterium]
MRVRSAPEQRSSPFYGWIVVWAAFAVMTVIFGVAYSFAAFFEPLAREFDAKRADVSWMFGLASLLYFSLGVVGGALADRHGPRMTGIVGIALLSGGLLLSSFATDLYSIYVAYGLGIGLGVAMAYTPSMGAVQPWFLRRRGLASGIASSGIGAGTLVVPLLAAWLIDAFDWRAAMRGLALFSLVVGLAAAWLLDRDPAARGLAPDGDHIDPHRPTDTGSTAQARPASRSTPSTARSATSLPGLPLRETIRSRRFHWLYAAALCAGAPMFVPFAHLSAAARDVGIGDAQAVALVGLIGIGSLVGRFAIGALADRLGRLKTHVIAQFALGASFALWWIGGPYANWALFAIVFGLSYGGIVSLLPPICSDLFGLRAVSSTIGLLYSGAGFGALLGPVLAGALFDRHANYDLAIAMCAFASALATFSAWRVLRLAAGRATARAGEPAPLQPKR